MRYWGYRPYVSVAQRRAKAQKRMASMAKEGRSVSPIEIPGRAIATTFWGKAWCEHLESCSDFSNRLPRGRTYVRNGSVVDLQIKPGKINAIVSGSDLYNVTISIDTLAESCWGRLEKRCGGEIASLVELLQGRLSAGVMQVITAREEGMFPNPAEINMKCSCPDYADMCKHVAAVLYGVGARLDEHPELLFTLRKVDHLELIAQAGEVQTTAEAGEGMKTLADNALMDVFGIDLEAPSEPAEAPAAPEPPPAKRSRVLVKKSPPKVAKGKKLAKASSPPVPSRKKSSPKASSPEAAKPRKTGRRNKSSP